MGGAQHLTASVEAGLQHGEEGDAATEVEPVPDELGHRGHVEGPAAPLPEDDAADELAPGVPPDTTTVGTACLNRPVELAFFRLDGDRLVPLDLARSMWRDDQMHGLAVSGALGRAIEARGLAAGRPELVPARYTVDLFKAASMEPCEVTTEVVREGPRLLLVDAVLRQGGEPVARASAVLLRRTEIPDGELWSPDDVPEPPPLDVAPDDDTPHIPFFHSEAGWSQDFGQHQNASRKQTWQTGIPVVVGERPSPFVSAASIADATSLVTNWGTRGVQYINTDITLSIARPPAGVQIGLLATDHHASDGIAVGSATVYDRHGAFGVATVTALANSRRTVDLSDGTDYQRGPKR